MKNLSALTVAALALLSPLVLAQDPAEPPSRKMDELNWVHFREIVPAKINTVILTTGTLEPHGVTANGSDNIAPQRIAEAIAPHPEINALIAPHISYGMTGGMAPYPGATHIPEEVYAPYIRAVLDGLKRNGFRNIIIVNGHGGPQTAVLMREARKFSIETEVNTLVINWWASCSRVAEEVFGNPGGHAGENETAFMQAIDPDLVHPELMEKITASPNQPSSAWQATPTPSSIMTYERGTGTPTDFDQAKADDYFAKVNECMAHGVKAALNKWRAEGFN